MRPPPVGGARAVGVPLREYGNGGGLDFGPAKANSPRTITYAEQSYTMYRLVYLIAIYDYKKNNVIYFTTLWRVKQSLKCKNTL